MMKSTEYILGCYLANHLIAKCIPCLSHNQTTYKVIEVTEEEAAIAKSLHDDWFALALYNKETQAEWNADMIHRYKLKAKYLPHTLKCFVPFIDFSNELINEEIKSGLIDTLWDWDYCDYSLKRENILFETKFIDHFGSFAYVTLKLDLSQPFSYTGNDIWNILE